MKNILRTITPFALALLVACGAGSSPRATAEKFYRAIEQGDYSQALGYTDIDDEDTELCCAVMEKARLSIAEKGGIESIEILREMAGSDENTEVQRTVVVTRIEYADSSSQEEYCDMILVDGKWRVDVDLGSK